MGEARPQRARIEAPRGVTRLELAEALVGPEGLRKAQEPKYHRNTFDRHPVVKQCLTRFTRAYEAMTRKMLAEIRAYVSSEILKGRKLGKSNGFVDDVVWPSDGVMVGKIGESDADSPYGDADYYVGLSLLTPDQLERLKAIIRDHHTAFAVQAIGPEVASRAELKRLLDIGALPPDLEYVIKPNVQSEHGLIRFTDTAYSYGRMLSNIEQRKAVRKMRLEQFERHAKEQAPLSNVEQHAMAWARTNAAQYIRGAGDRFAMEAGVIIMDADAEQRRRYIGAVAEEVEDAIDKRESWRKLASNIGHRTQDWSRDMQRLAATESQWAMQEGQAHAIARGRDPEEIYVYKQPSPDACPDCVRLHLTAGPGSTPKIFKLSEIQSNGTNVGKKRRDWKAVVGPTHPWCGCDLNEVPAGWGFDEDGDLVPEVMLKKAEGQQLTYTASVPTQGVAIRIADPRMRAVAENVVAEAPAEIFRNDVGITLITTETPRVQNPLDDHDYAYWTGNEIRVMQTLPIERLPRVLRHEIGHSLNVHLMKKLGTVDAVRRWHDQLWAVSKREGFVSDYAKKLPIENAAEVTRMWIFERDRLMRDHPRQFAVCRRAYGDIGKGRG